MKVPASAERTSVANSGDARPAVADPTVDRDMAVPAVALLVPRLASGDFVIRPKLEVGGADDAVEVEADRVADEVVAAVHGGARVSRPQPVVPVSGQKVWRALGAEVGAAGGGLSAEMHSAITSARAGGRALPGQLRATMEGALGADLSDVRVHTGPGAEALNAGVAARAFTVDNDVFFRGGLPGTSSVAGTHLLAHELTHVLQARGGRGGGAAHRVMTGATIRRNQESAELLKELATPKMFPGPDIPLQDSIVDRLEEKIPESKNLRQLAVEKSQRANDEWERIWKEQHPTGGQEEKNEDKKEFLRNQEPLPPDYDKAILFLGSIELESIPAKVEDEGLMIDNARLIDSDNALATNLKAVDLCTLAGVDQDLVTNTLKTMQAAKQIEYLRKSGFVGKGWKILVEIHYYRDRSTVSNNLHKDTLGQTLFVNLNYTNKETQAGAEYLANPPQTRQLDGMLPDEFVADLGAVSDQTPKGSKIKAPDLIPNGVIAFVDEAIHHATPLIGHREVTAKDLADYLDSDPRFAKLPAARSEYNKSFGFWSFSAYAKDVDSTLAEMWLRLKMLCEKGQQKTFTRPELVKAGMSSGGVDELLSTHGPKGFRSVSIPGKARGKEGGHIIEEEGKPKVLQRTMSHRALKGTLPPKTVGKRRFFRTWVRAIPTG